MRKIALALAAIAAVGLTVPVASAPAEARTKVVIVHKKHHWDRGRHYGPLRRCDRSSDVQKEIRQ